jgi:transcriptional regulator with XRE-family HTH domain
VEPSTQERAFGTEVARQRTARHVTQDRVARQVSLSRSKISEIEHGRFLPSWTVLNALITALALDQDQAIRLWRAAAAPRPDRPVLRPGLASSAMAQSAAPRGVGASWFRQRAHSGDFWQASYFAPAQPCLGAPRPKRSWGQCRLPFAGADSVPSDYDDFPCGG